MELTKLVVLLCAALCVAGPATACIFKFGTSPDSLSAPHGGTHWDHGLNGDDWTGVDAAGKPWTCMSGLRQSPINVPPIHYFENRGQTIPGKHRTTWSYPVIISNGSDVEVINNGHAIQVEWLSPYAADVEIVVPVKQSNTTPITAVLSMDESDRATTVRATPLQFHFHTVSEHLIVGKYYPLEMHIVHRVTELPACAGGCFSVTGVLFELVEGGDNPLLDSIWAAMPMREGMINYLPAGAEIRLEELLPEPDARDYVTYEGSLTTPPCTEGLLWHVMTKPQKISHAQWTKFKSAVGLKECVLANQTPASANTTSQEHHHHHHHHHRRMLEEAAAPTVAAVPTGSSHEEEHVGNPDDYTCRVVAYGANYRSSQKLYGRTVRFARA